LVNTYEKASRLLIPGLFLALTVSAALHAQTATSAPAAANATAATPAPSGQAPDEMTKKITLLVHAGKYAEAQRLTDGLLVAYTDDQRLIKAKAFIEKLLAPGGGSTRAAASSSQPAQPAVTANTAPLAGMDQVDYNALLVLGRQAQQTTDLDEQEKLLRQFMDQSSVFLQNHPEQLLI
jgi:hypothetical protein